MSGRVTFPFIPSLTTLCYEALLLKTVAPRDSFDAAAIREELMEIIPATLVTQRAMHMAHMFGWYRALCQPLVALHSKISRDEYFAVTTKVLVSKEIDSIARYREPVNILDMCRWITSTGLDSVAYYLLKVTQQHSLYVETYFVVELQLIGYPWHPPVVTIHSALPHPFFKSGTSVPRPVFGRHHPTDHIESIFRKAFQFLLLDPSLDLRGINSAHFSDKLYLMLQEDPDMFIDTYARTLTDSRNQLYPE